MLSTGELEVAKAVTLSGDAPVHSLVHILENMASMDQINYYISMANCMDPEISSPCKSKPHKSLISLKAAGWTNASPYGGAR
jgi:hypothetical protein